MDSINLNREIAYLGNMGKLREEFCISYIKRKQVTLNRIQREINEQIELSDEQVKCRKGCSYCCALYVEANIQECEAIVYYLYHHDNILSLFLSQYPTWREKMRQSGDLFKKCEQALHDTRKAEHSTIDQQALADALLFYKIQNVPCPFLSSGICTIYEVRPYTCANHYATTPAEWCNPLNPQQTKVYNTTIEDDIYDLAFYPKKLDKPLIEFMALAVYEILNRGFSFISDMAGLEEIAKVINKPEISSIIKKHEND